MTVQNSLNTGPQLGGPESKAHRNGLPYRLKAQRQTAPSLTGRHLRLSHELCQPCSRLEVRAMLQEETIEVKMGPLSDHLTPYCPFCDLISEAVRRNWGDGWSSERLCSESDPAPRIFIQSKSPFSIKIDGHIRHPQPRLLMALDVTPPGHSENRRVIREVDRVKDRFIIAEIETVLGDYDEAEQRDPPLVPRREVGPTINYDLVLSWLELCKAHMHTKKAQESMEFGMFHCRDGFRLIDVDAECLVLVKHRCAFAALSYVWGNMPTILQPALDSQETPVLLTTLENLNQLSTPGGLSPNAMAEMTTARLPKTIRDAMIFSREIGMQYLWIDTLCIVQDDPRDKDFMIRSMDDVYDHAAVTLIAASGSDADGGLGGVTTPRHGRPINSFTVIDDGVVEHLSICPPSLGEEVRSSVWNTRGWTFQEQALSQRCLYFTPDELFFNCIALQWREAYDLEHIDPTLELTMRTGSPWWNRKLRKDPDPTPYRYLGDLTGTLTIKDYEAAVQDYSRKTLTFPGDVLNAFEGVVNRFNKCTRFGDLTLEQTQGIPVHLLHLGLLWFPSEEARIRVCPERDDVAFSSWSWASWEGPIEFVFADSMWISRNISYILYRHVPVHNLILRWRYGGTEKEFQWKEIWGDSVLRSKIPATSNSLEMLQDYAEDRIGVQVSELDKSLEQANMSFLRVGDVGFMGAYIEATAASLVVKHPSNRVHSFEIGGHRGEFRFDMESTEVDEFVAVLTSDTITKPPNIQSILLGVTTVDGISRRVGLGWIFFKRGNNVTKPPWRYRYFTLR